LISTRIQRPDSGIELELDHRHAGIGQRAHEAPGRLEHPRVERQAHPVRAPAAVERLVDAPVLEGHEHLAVGGEHLDPGTDPAEVLLREPRVAGRDLRERPHHRLGRAVDAHLALLPQRPEHERGRRLEGERQPERPDERRGVGGGVHRLLARQRDPEPRPEGVRLRLAVDDREDRVGQQVHARVRLHERAGGLQGQEARVVARDHQIDGVPAYERDECRGPHVGALARGGQRVRLVHVARAERQRVRRRPGHVDLDAVASERADHREEGARVGAQHQSAPLSGAARRGVG
jgi:hypothetical protein